MEDTTTWTYNQRRRLSLRYITYLSTLATLLVLEESGIRWLLVQEVAGNALFGVGRITLVIRIRLFYRTLGLGETFLFFGRRNILVEVGSMLSVIRICIFHGTLGLRFGKFILLVAITQGLESIESRPLSVFAFFTGPWVSKGGIAGMRTSHARCFALCACVSLAFRLRLHARCKHAYACIQAYACDSLALALAMHACICVCERACVRAHANAFVRACVRMRAYACVRMRIRYRIR